MKRDGRSRSGDLEPSCLDRYPPNGDDARSTDDGRAWFVCARRVRAGGPIGSRTDSTLNRHISR
ncbi:hypothetical protein EL22_07785 [Halostagnicola sp. A56]|nr:hypothetical protein EL22_07785 [Halostagnicola sp. A56]